MPPSLDAAALAGHSLISVITELAGRDDWDMVEPLPDGSVELSNPWSAPAPIGPGSIFRLVLDSPKLRALVQAMETGKLQTEADGGFAENYAAISVPSGLWGQRSDIRHWSLHKFNGGELRVFEEGHCTGRTTMCVSLRQELRKHLRLDPTPVTGRRNRVCGHSCPTRSTRRRSLRRPRLRPTHQRKLIGR